MFKKGNIIYLVSASGEEIEYEIFRTIDEFDSRYAALIPYLEDFEPDNEKNVIMEITQEEGEEKLIPVEDEGLLDQLFEIFNKQIE